MKKLSVLLGCILTASLTMANAQSASATPAPELSAAKSTQLKSKKVVRKHLRKRTKAVARSARPKNSSSPALASANSSMAPAVTAAIAPVTAITAVAITAHAAPQSAPQPATIVPAKTSPLATAPATTYGGYSPKVSAWQSDAPYVNPYLAYREVQPAPAAPAHAQASAPEKKNTPVIASSPSVPSTSNYQGNIALPAMTNPFSGMSNPLDGLKSLLPAGISEMSILPSIKTVYPTGEKPLVVLTLKCPTELIGIPTPSTMILHEVINGGMGLINKTNLLSFNMEQVCQ